MQISHGEPIGEQNDGLVFGIFIVFLDFHEFSLTSKAKEA